MIDNAAQHTIAWFRARHGNITGSNVGLLMKSGRTDIFSETGKSYIYQIASERAMNPAIVNDDSQVAEYLKQTEVTSRRYDGATNKRRMLATCMPKYPVCILWRSVRANILPFHILPAVQTVFTTTRTPA